MTRRHVLETAAAAGSLALAGGVSAGRAQGAKRIEQLSPDLGLPVPTRKK